MRKLISTILKKFNYKLVKNRSNDFFPKEFINAYKKITPYSMVDESDAYAAWQAINYVANRKIEGDIVECGVWRGGVSILMAERLKQLNINNREQYLYDTFEGMSEPTEKDLDKHGVAASEQLSTSTRSDGKKNVWAYASIDDVKQNFIDCGLSPDSSCMIKGKVEETIPKEIPSVISVLRLDTDWYESTKHELTHLYPRLSQGGVLLIDDYGYWSGCREAVEEYFSDDIPRPYMTFLPSGSIVAIKL